MGPEEVVDGFRLIVQRADYRLETHVFADQLSERRAVIHGVAVIMDEQWDVRMTFVKGRQVFPRP